MPSDLFRARLTGNSAVDPDDTTHASPDKTALLEYVIDDTAFGAGTPVPETGAARIMLPTNLGCPLYAARYHFFQDLTFNAAISDDASKPRVIVRRDVTATVGPAETACYTIVANVVVTGTLQGRADPMTGALVAGPVHVEPGDFGLVTVRDNVGNVQAGVICWFPNIIGEAAIGPGALVWMTCRTTHATGVGHDAAAPDCWVGYQADFGNHAHLVSGSGRAGGGPSFAAFSPSSYGEANALGYEVP